MCIVSLAVSAQLGTKRQYFDGFDTVAETAILVEMDTSDSNVWQIATPAKTIFSSAFTLPGALITDPVNNIPAGNVSRFYFSYVPVARYEVLALRWAQKLDLEPGRELGMIEYSTDRGGTWQNVFNNPYVYNFYGFDQANADTLPGGSKGFSGRDESWKDIWLCFSLSWLNSVTDTLWMRYSLLTDTVVHDREGWMIDNLMSHLTIFHTSVKKTEQASYFDIYPNPADDRVYLRGAAKNQFHVIEEMQLTDMSGKMVRQWGVTPVKFYFDTKDLPAGAYVLRIKTNLRSVTYPLVIRHNR